MIGGVIRHMLPHLPGVSTFICKQALSFWEFHFVVVQNNSKEMSKNVLHEQICFFWLIRPIVIFSPFWLPSPLSIT